MLDDNTNVGHVQTTCTVGYIFSKYMYVRCVMRFLVVKINALLCPIKGIGS